MSYEKTYFSVCVYFGIMGKRLDFWKIKDFICFYCDLKIIPSILLCGCFLHFLRWDHRYFFVPKYHNSLPAPDTLAISSCISLRPGDGVNESSFRRCFFVGCGKLWSHWELLFFSPHNLLGCEVRSIWKEKHTERIRLHFFLC